MSAGGENLIFGLGIMLTVTASISIFRPQSLVRSSRRNWVARLRELDAGAPEAYFEERRELEAYPPRFDLSHNTMRQIGFVELALGILCIIWGMNK